MSMKRGLRIGLTIAGSLVAVVAVIVAVALHELERGAKAARQRIEANAAQFCGRIAIGSDVAALATATLPKRDVVPLASGNVQYRFESWGGLYDLAECRVTVDAKGKVVARQSGWVGAFPRDAASGVTALLSG